MVFIEYLFVVLLMCISSRWINKKNSQLVFALKKITMVVENLRFLSEFIFLEFLLYFIRLFHKKHLMHVISSNQIFFSQKKSSDIVFSSMLLV